MVWLFYGLVFVFKVNKYKEYVVIGGNIYYIIFRERVEFKILYVMCIKW